MTTPSFSFQAVAQYVGAHPNFESLSDDFKLQFYALYKTVDKKATYYTVFHRTYLFLFDHKSYKKWLAWWVASENYSPSEAQARYFQLARDIDAFPPDSLKPQMTCNLAGTGSSKMLPQNQDQSVLVESGMDHLIDACASDTVAIIQQFIQGGGDVNLKNEEGTTLLHFAIDHGSIDIVQTLVQNGADVNSADDENIVPLDTANLNENEDISRYLRAHGARPSITN